MSEMTDPRALEIMRRLTAMYGNQPILDKGRAEAALARHFGALGLVPRPVRWVQDAEQGCLAAVGAGAARSAPWSMMGTFSCLNWELSFDWPAAMRAAMNPAWRVTRRAALPPAWRTARRAVVWPAEHAARAAKVIMAPWDLTVKDIRHQRNVAVRRVMLQQYGEQRFLRDSGAQLLQEDRFGELYRQELPHDEPLVMVRVLNGTPEPTGEQRIYWLRVPPQTQTAHEGVAWSFGLTPAQYDPVVET